MEELWLDVSLGLIETTSKLARVPAAQGSGVAASCAFAGDNAARIKAEDRAAISELRTVTSLVAAIDLME
jgi:hypothetical protein